MRRTDVAIRNDVFNAVSRIIKEEGYTKLSIGRIATYADMENVVIYHHFDTLENLLLQYVDRMDFWLRHFPKEKKVTTREAYCKCFEKLAIAVHGDAEIQQLLVWEISEDNEITRNLSKQRLSVRKKHVAPVEDFSAAGINIDAISTILITSAYYLAIQRSKFKPDEINILPAVSLESIESSQQQIIDLLYDKYEKIAEKKIARSLLADGVPLATISKATGLSPEEIKKL